jgi:hypothetical protein
VNWWATWPAPPTGGIVVTDRAVLRLERGGDLDGELAPPEIYEALRGQWPQIRRRAQEAAARAFPDQSETAAILRPVGRARRDDRRHRPIIHRGRPLDLMVVYLPGLDIAQNALLGAPGARSRRPRLPPRVDALRSYYPYLDRACWARWSKPYRERTHLIVDAARNRVQTSTCGSFSRGADDAQPNARETFAIVNTPAK